MITLITMLRILPYALAGLLAYQKGYKRLAFAMVYVIAIATLRLFIDLSPMLKGVLAAPFSLIIYWHAADLTPKQRR